MVNTVAVMELSVTSCLHCC